MKEDFITFEKFNDQYEAKVFGKLLEEQNIDYLLEDNSMGFDASFANNSYGKEFCIKIKKENFEKVTEILETKSEKELSEINQDHYLLSFSDEELIDVVSKSDEWNKFDVALAKKLLKERGQEITPEKIEEIKNDRITELSKPEESKKGHIILGYIGAFLGGILGVFYGWYLLTHKKTLPNGNRVYVFSESDRKQGNRIFIIGIIFSVIWFAIQMIFKFKEAISMVNMKKAVLILVFFLFQSINGFSQNSEIDQSWLKIRREYISKAEVVLQLTVKFQKSELIEKTELKQTEVYAKELNVACGNPILNNENVNQVKQKNDSLNTHLVRVLVELESDFKLKTKNEILTLSGQLADSESKIYNEIIKYNEICEKLNKKELIFPIAIFKSE